MKFGFAASALRSQRRHCAGHLAGIVAAMLVLSACGQTGPLFLPKPVEPPKQAPADASPDAAKK